MTIPDSVTSLGWRCFHDCRALASVTIPENITSIGDECFEFCSSLKEILFKGDAITTCGSGAFSAQYYEIPKDRRYIFEKKIPDVVASAAGVTDENCYYRIKFVDDAGAVLQQNDVLKANCPYTDVTAPTVSASPITGAAFKGWDSEAYKNVTDTGMVVTAQYEETDPIDISDGRVSVKIDAQIYTGSQIKPSSSALHVTFKRDSSSKEIALVEGTHYRVSEYGENIGPGAGSGSVKIAGERVFDGERTVSFDIGKDIAVAGISGIKASYEETGSAIEPVPTVTYCPAGGQATKLKAGADYDVSYANNKSVGTATVTITGKGNWAGVKTATFKITARPVVGAAAWKRLSGNTAIGTMKQIVNEGWKQSDWAIVATTAGYYDALSASGLAGLLDCPILMTSPTSLTDATSALIKSKGVKNVIVVGGTSAVSDNVFNQIKKLGVSVERVAGGTAIGTANKIYTYGNTLLKAGKIKSGWGTDAIVATASGYQDALSIAPYAYAKKAPIFLASGKPGTLTNSTVKLLKAGGFKRTIITGSEVAVAKSVESQVVGAKRLGGGTAYGTSRKIADFAISQGMEAAHMGVATGKSYYDALAGAALCGKKNSVLILADDGNSNTVDNVVKPNKKALEKSCYIFGGTSAVSTNVENKIKEASK